MNDLKHAIAGEFHPGCRGWIYFAQSSALSTYLWVPPELASRSQQRSNIEAATAWMTGGRQGTAQQQQRASAANHGFAAAQDPGADPREATATAAEPEVELLAGDAAAAAARIDMLAVRGPFQL